MLTVRRRRSSVIVVACNGYVTNSSERDKRLAAGDFFAFSHLYDDLLQPLKAIDAQAKNGIWMSSKR